jgi:mono/diheme cytochrome c family protein
MNRSYRFALVSVLCGLVMCVLALGTHMGSRLAQAQATAAATQAASNIERGRFLATIANCGMCHGAPDLAAQDQPAPLAGGQEFNLGPLGTYYAPNLTNLQSMDLETFDLALRQGIAPYTDRVMAPIMPYNLYHGMADSDVAALLAYLQTLTPVTNSVKQSVPGTAAANLQSPAAQSVPGPVIDTSANYGRYLVETVANCGQCHSPADATGTVAPGRELTGGTRNLGRDGQQLFAPSIVGPALNTAGYTQQTFIQLFRTGKKPAGTDLAPQMPWRRFGMMSDNDLTAVWNHLQTKQPAAATAAAPGGGTPAATAAPAGGPVATQSR